MKVSLKQFSEAVAAIHGSTADPRRWATVLAAVTQMLEASKGAIFDLDRTTGDMLAVTTLGHDPDAQRHYVLHYHAIDPTMRLMLETAPHQPRTAYDRFSEGLRARHEYFNFARSIDIGDAIGVSTCGVDAQRSVLSLQRSYGGATFDAESKQIMALIAPHIEMAKHVQAKLSEALTAHSALAAGLDNFAAAAFIVDGAANVRHLNLAARNLLSRDRRFRVRHGRLSCGEPRLSAAVDAALRCATHGPSRSTAVPLPLDGGEVAEIVVSPLHPAHDLVAPWQLPLALVVVAAPRLDAAMIARRVRLLYGLTHAEARVMACLALGQTVEEIALAHVVRESTVRSQLRSLFAKTGVGRQADLVRLALGGAPLIPHP